MSDYRLRFHLLRLPQLDKFDGANQRERLGFALGVDADFDPSAFTDAQGRLRRPPVPGCARAPGKPAAWRWRRSLRT